MAYQRNPVKAPRVSGLALKAFVNTLESSVGAPVLEKLVRDSGITPWRELSPGDAPPLQFPLPPGAPATEPQSPGEQAVRAIAARTSAPERETVGAFVRAYREGKADPVAVARRLNETIDKLEQGEARMGMFITRKPEEVLRAAEASAERLRAGRPLSVLDGVPVVVKDEVDVAGFPTTLGTRFRNQVASADATVAARLRAAGALILGKANMQEIGINPIGLNPHHGAARNPWNLGHITGGSSSGSAAVVAAGLCPLSVGADGGGSIRIPAALCGIVGLKATWGRIPETGVPPLCWNVGHVGPMGLTVDDVAALYALLAGPDGKDVVAQTQPAHHLSGYERADLTGIRLGICWPYFEDAAPDVVARCKDAVKALTNAGAVVVEIPAPDLNTVLWTHSCIILSEMAESMLPHTRERVSDFGLDSRTNLAIGRHFRATDLVHALRHRHRLTRELLAVMSGVDVIITPTTAISAPAIPESTLPDGESNLQVADALMRFVREGNLTGFPALSVPAGHDRAGLPVGVQLMGRPFEEHLLLRLGRVVESATPVRTPSLHVTALR
ncbi:amidase [Myxococcus landrumensis]|uniref:Amidase n=1 Tax=Myxococcus landrumensis TaxID=2813577 RepID=A0ABX7NDT4_9BACT|nr:amidase [Myxococcus landrumus]QSQ16962.1 amidase [Myxococcus landrumus]